MKRKRHEQAIRIAAILEKNGMSTSMSEIPNMSSIEATSDADIGCVMTLHIWGDGFVSVMSSSGRVRKDAWIEAMKEIIRELEG